MYRGQTKLLAEHGGSWSSYLWLGGEAVRLVRGGALYLLHEKRPPVAAAAAMAD